MIDHDSHIPILSCTMAFTSHSIMASTLAPKALPTKPWCVCLFLVATGSSNAVAHPHLHFHHHSLAPSNGHMQTFTCTCNITCTCTCTCTSPLISKGVKHFNPTLLILSGSLLMNSSSKFGGVLMDLMTDFICSLDCKTDLPVFPLICDINTPLPIMDCFGDLNTSFCVSPHLRLELQMMPHLAILHPIPSLAISFEHSLVSCCALIPNHGFEFSTTSHMHLVMNILVACNVSALATTIFEPDYRHFVEAVLIKAVLIDHNMHEIELNHHVTMAHNVSHVIVPHVILLQAPLSLITTSLPGVLWPACLFWQLRPTCLIWQLHVPTPSPQKVATFPFFTQN